MNKLIWIAWSVCQLPDLFVNYRPIANIPFLSKVIEKSVAIQVHNYLNCHGLFPSLQSAYRKHHSSESALLRVSNDIFRILDSQGEVILVLLDLSAAVDTIDHHLLLTRIRTYFNFTETVLQWFSSYLLDRFQQVTISDYILTTMLKIWSALRARYLAHYFLFSTWHLFKMLYLLMI